MGKGNVGGGFAVSGGFRATGYEETLAVTFHMRSYTIGFGSIGLELMGVKFSSIQA